MRLIDADALRQEIFFHRFSVAILDNEHAVLNEVFDKIDTAPTVITNGAYEALCTITDQEFEHSDGFWVKTPKGKKIYFKIDKIEKGGETDASN